MISRVALPPSTISEGKKCRTQVTIKITTVGPCPKASSWTMTISGNIIRRTPTMAEVKQIIQICNFRAPLSTTTSATDMAPTSLTRGNRKASTTISWTMKVRICMEVPPQFNTVNHLLTISHTLGIITRTPHIRRQPRFMISIRVRALDAPEMVVHLSSLSRGHRLAIAHLIVSTPITRPRISKRKTPLQQCSKLH